MRINGEKNNQSQHRKLMLSNEPWNLLFEETMEIAKKQATVKQGRCFALIIQPTGYDLRNIEI